MATAIAQPSTPNSTSSRFGKLLNKIRTTPNSISTHHHSYSTPTLQRATSKGSSHYAPTNLSSVSVNSLSPSLMDLEMPTFEGDWLNKDWSPHMGLNQAGAGAGASPYSSKAGATTTDSLVSATSLSASSTHLPLKSVPSEETNKQSAKFTRSAAPPTSSSLNFDARPPPTSSSSSSSPPLPLASSSNHGSRSSYVSSAYTSSGSAAGSGGSVAGGESLDSSGDGIRKKPLLLSRSTSAAGEGGLKGLAKWASRDLLGRSLGRSDDKKQTTTTTSMMDAVENDGARRASADVSCLLD